MTMVHLGLVQVDTQQSDFHIQMPAYLVVTVEEQLCIHWQKNVREL